MIIRPPAIIYLIISIILIPRAFSNNTNAYEWKILLVNIVTSNPHIIETEHKLKKSGIDLLIEFPNDEVFNTIDNFVSNQFYIKVSEYHETHAVKINLFKYSPSSTSLYKTKNEEVFINAKYNCLLFSQINVDSYYPTYNSIPLVDSTFITENLKYNEAAWASAETTNAHWIECTYDKQREVDTVVIYWALDKGEYYISEKILLISLNHTNGEFPISYKSKTDIELGRTTYSFKPSTASGIRILQPPGGGSGKRPNLMWVREVCAYENIEGE